MQKIRKKLFSYKKAFTIDRLSERGLKCQYAVRGFIPMKAAEIENEIQKNPENFSFSRVIKLNIGNPQSFNQKPNTFMRDLMSNIIIQNPNQLDQKFFNKKNVNAIDQEYFDAVNAETNLFLEKIDFSKPSEVQGFQFIREQIAEFIQHRDNYPSNADDILMSNGASTSIYQLLEKLISDNKNSGIMYSCPQYPIYSGLVGLFGGKHVQYYLSEENGWGIDKLDLISNYDKAIREGVNIKAIVVINPGNPTGSVLNEESLEQIVEFAEERNLMIISDEVYQENIYDGKFVSMKKVVCDMKSKVQLASFHSLSKGIFGECGIRGGYMEMFNFNENLKNYFHSLKDISVPNNIGQIGMGFMARFLSGNIKQNIGPLMYQRIREEYDEIHSSLKFRAGAAEQRMEEMTNITMNPIQGALYLFPKIEFPQKMINDAQKHNLTADTFYALNLLEQTGICVVPGSGFGQKENTWHLRSTILPLPESLFVETFDRWKEFHNKFIEFYEQQIQQQYLRIVLLQNLLKYIIQEYELKYFHYNSKPLN